MPRPCFVLAAAALIEPADDPEGRAEPRACAVGELVARICAGLSVIPDWSLWADQAWATDYAKSLPPDNDIGAERRPDLEPSPDAASATNDAVLDSG